VKPRRTFIVTIVSIIGLCSGKERGDRAERYLIILLGGLPPDADGPSDDV